MQTYKALIGKTYFKGRHNNENPIVNPDGKGTVSLFAIARALEFLDAETQYYQVVEITPKPPTFDCNFEGAKTECIDPIPYSEWQTIFDKTRETITSQGGIPLFFVKKYGWGHVSLHPSIPSHINEDMLILDPRGAHKKGEIAEEPLAKYTALVGYVLGVVPNLPDKNSRNLIP